MTGRVAYFDHRAASVQGVAYEGMAAVVNGHVATERLTGSLEGTAGGVAMDSLTAAGGKQ